MRTKRNTNYNVGSNLRSNEKPGFSNRKNIVFDSSVINGNRSKSEGLPEVYLHGKKHHEIDKTQKEEYDGV